MKEIKTLSVFLVLAVAISAGAKGGANGNPEFSIRTQTTCEFVKYKLWSNNFCKDARLIYLKNCKFSEDAMNQFKQIIHSEKSIPELVVGTGYMARCYPEDKAVLLDQYFESVVSGSTVYLSASATTAVSKGASERVDRVDTVQVAGQSAIRTTEAGGRTNFDPLYELFFMIPGEVGDWLP